MCSSSLIRPISSAPSWGKRSNSSSPSRATSTAFEDARENRSKNSRALGGEADPHGAGVYQSPAGNEHVTVRPPPAVAVASTVPPAAATTCLTIASPRPVPRLERAWSAR